MTTPPGEQTQLGRYQLVRKLAMGGMAEVFLAKAVGPGGFEKQLVIKRILPHLAKDPEFVQMFLHEAKLAAQFAHPAVVQIFDFGEVNGSFFLAMEFVDGPNLRTILRRAPDRKIPFVLGARVIAEACEGLAYVHEFADPNGQPMGLVHLDVSSDNLLIARNGAVKVVDFGVAKGAGQISNAAPGTVKGKIAYMPPEQIIGEADHRSDVYALGVILYELAAGTKPYDNLPDPKLLEAIIKTDPVPLLTRNPATPPEFAMIVGKAMAKNLDARFQSARELAAALDDFIANSGERVGARQLAALATASEDGPLAAGDSKPITRTPATPFKAGPPAPAPTRASGAFPVAARAPVAASPSSASSSAAPAIAPLVPAPARPAATHDPFAAFGDEAELVETGGDEDLALSATVYDEFFAASSPARPTGTPAPRPAPAPLATTPVRSTGSTPALRPAPSPAVQPAPPAAPVVPPLTSGSPSSPFITGKFPAFIAKPSSSPSATASAPVTSPSRPPSAITEDEQRAQTLMADATAMRLYDAGPLLVGAPELELLRQEFDKDEGFHLLVRFPRQAARLLKLMPNAAGLLAERTAGAVEALLMAEAYGPLATLFERLVAGSGIDEHQKWVHQVAVGALATADQAHRLAMRLREAAPQDAEGLGRLLPHFGAALVPVWLSLSEVIEVPPSREALLPGLAGLAALNPAPFIERLQEKRPRRLADFVFCLERGKVRERVPLFKDLQARLDPMRKREFLTGLARAGTDEAQRQLAQALSDPDEETRLHAVQLIGKHLPERAWKILGPLLDASVDRPDAERRAMWKAIGVANQLDGLTAMRESLAQKGSLLTRGKIETFKLHTIEGLSAMQLPGALEVLRAAADDRAHSEEVRNLAARYARTFDLQPSSNVQIAEGRRWERTPSTWRDVVLDLHSLALASRAMDVALPAFDAAFARLMSRLEALLGREGQAALRIEGKVISNNGLALGTDASLEAAAAAFVSRGVAGFSFSRKVARQELEHLVRWLAAGPAAEGIQTPGIERTLSPPAAPRPAPPPLGNPSLSDPSREAMVRYVNLVLAMRRWLHERKANPRAAPPDTRALFHELALVMSTRNVRFLGLTPRNADRDAELFHAANVLCQALAFGAEIGLGVKRLTDLAHYAFFTEIGTLELRDDTFTRSGPLTEEDQRDIANARRSSTQFPFVKLGDNPGALGWATAVAELDVDWGAKDRPAAVGERSNVGLMGSLVALCRAYETLTATTSRRQAMTHEAALEMLSRRVSFRFRPELVPLFDRFGKRMGFKPLKR